MLKIMYCVFYIRTEFHDQIYKLNTLGLHHDQYACLFLFLLFCWTGCVFSFFFFFFGWEGGKGLKEKEGKKRGLRKIVSFCCQLAASIKSWRGLGKIFSCCCQLAASIKGCRESIHKYFPPLFVSCEGSSNQSIRGDHDKDIGGLQKQEKRWQ